MRRTLVSLAVVALAAVALPAVASPSPVPEVVDTPQGRVAGPTYLAAHYGRLADQVQHEEYRARLEAERAQCPADAFCRDTDPYVAAWTRANLRQERGTLPGTAVAYELLLPREGALSPVDGQPLRASFPGVVLLPGGGTPKEVYRGVAQGLATTGYAVMSVDPECNLAPCGPPATPEQELGGAVGLATLVASIAGSCATTGCDYSALEKDYRASEATYQAAGTAALQALADRPGLVDRSRTGVVGHSLGAYNAALLAQRRDLPTTVRAAVAWDGYASLPAAPALRTPVQFHAYEGQDLVPHPFRPDETPAHDDAARLQKAGVATGVVALRSSAHYEVGHLPYDSALFRGASRLGERIALDATLAWLDLHLGTGRTAARGRAALLSERLSPAVDTVSHGQGTEAPDGRNVPYAVGGQERADHLSLLLRSWYDLADGTACADVVRGCR